MARFLRCVGVDNVAYHINLDQVAWVFRPRGANHTVIKLSGAETLTVRESPHHIIGHTGDHREHEHHDSRSMPRTRMGVGIARTARGRESLDVDGPKPTP